MCIRDSMYRPRGGPEYRTTITASSLARSPVVSTGAAGACLVPQRVEQSLKQPIRDLRRIANGPRRAGREPTSRSVAQPAAPQSADKHAPLGPETSKPRPPYRGPGRFDCLPNVVEPTGIEPVTSCSQSVVGNAPQSPDSLGIAGD